MTTDVVQQFNETNKELDKCSKLASKQPLPHKKLVPMMDANFKAADYAILTEDDPNQRHSSVKSPMRP